MRRIILLHEDMGTCLAEWTNNHYASQGQKKLWPQNRKITRTLLANNIEGCLRLLEDDGHNGETVGSRSESAVRKWFDDNENHKKPPTGDLIRFGIFFHLGFHRTLALVLKRDWEKFCAKKADWINDPLGRNLFDILKDIKQAQELVPEFNSYLKGKFDLPYLKRDFDLNGLFQVFENYGGMASNAGYDMENFPTLVEHMITSEMHTFANDSLELQDFIEKEQLEMEVLKYSSEEESEEFWVKKCCWLELKNETGNLLLELENQRLKNENIVQQWMATFGKTYLELTELKSAYFYLQRLLQIKEADENISLGDAQEIELEKRLQEEDALEKLKMEVARAGMIKNFGIDGGKGIGEEELSAYDRECKEVLREIWRLTHPDGISQQRFTETQKQKLIDCFDRSIKIRDEEIGGFRRRLSILHGILAEVKSHWENMGLDINPENDIKGETLREKIEFLEARILSLEEQKKRIQAGHFVLLKDHDIQEKQKSLATEQQKTELLKQLEEKKEYYKKRIDVMKTKAAELFGEEPAI